MSLQNSLCQVATIIYGPAAEKCEDACSYSFEKPDLHYAGVFDGCGGLGSKRYERLNNKTGAFISSQTCAVTFNDEMKKKASTSPVDDAYISHLKGVFLATLKNTKNNTDSKAVWLDPWCVRSHVQVPWSLLRKVV